MGTITQTQLVRPRPGMMYGLTHTLDGDPIIREPKLLKVGIGCLKGPAIEVFLRGGQWTIRTGFKRGEIKTYPFPSREKAEIAYPKYRETAPVCPYPRKLDYFNFSRPAADGTLEPDWDAIEAHGDQPTSIDVVFFDDNPLDGSYAYWSTSELKCRGDGINAERVLSMASTGTERDLADQAKVTGSKYFPIIEGCCTRGCQYARETMQGEKTVPPPCKPHGDLKFQLAKNLRVGGTAYFHTTGFRSISQLFSCLYRFKCLTGGGDVSRGYLVGIPFKMVLRQFRTKHNGQSGTAYGVSLEFRAETVDALVHNMIEQGAKFRGVMLGAAPAATRRIAAPAQPMPGTTDEETDVAGAVEDETATAQAMAAEFGSDGIEEGEEPEGIPEEDHTPGTFAQQEAVADRRIAELKAAAGEPPEQAPEMPAPAAPAPKTPFRMGKGVRS
jgi:hypothetical protein